MDKPRTFRNLTVWQKAITLAKMIYEVTRQLPGSEQFGLVNQMRRAAVSIPSNIAEGNARESRKDYIRHLVIARGSLAELETQIVIASELKFLPETAPVMSAITEISQMLQALITSLKRKDQPPLETRD
jgi:four helix bundle protein